MCGIAGVVSRRVAERALVMAMLDAMAHRGPDGAGVFSHSETGCDVVLGHRRLSIIDLSDDAAQPMTDVSGRYVITFNGEIYNYLEIRQQLSGAGVAFRSHSDTEVLLEAYKAWGTACLQKLNGMFAFCILDTAQRKLFCARDRYGEKPFLFSFGRDFFVFASEYKAILRHPSISLELDEWRLILAGYNPSTGLDAERRTVFKDVQQLLPGEAMEVELLTLAQRTWRYWSIPPGGAHDSRDESRIAEEYRELLIDAVRLRMRSDVTVGSCLSGGLDSSAIVCIARRLLGADVPYHTFTGRFPGTAADEWQFAQQVVTFADVTSHIVEPTAEGFLDSLPDFLWFNELPVGSSSQFAQWCVFRLARQEGVTVLLDGQGADEALGGYEQYFAAYVRALEERGDRDRLDRELQQIRRRYPLALPSTARRWRDRLPFSLRRALSRYFGLGSNMLYGIAESEGRRALADAPPRRLDGFDPLASVLVQDSFGRFLTTLLRYGDRNSMAHSREVRLPFCDHRLAELVFSLPPHILMGEAQTKRLLRESMRGILPESIRTRWNKQGFRPPQDRWLATPRFVAALRETFSSAAFRQGPYWTPRWWDAALKRLENGETNLAWTLWQPFIIEQWKQAFVHRVGASRRSVAIA
jgi:asparagine synthase (glutamine-hydrolysing)